MPTPYQGQRCRVVTSIRDYRTGAVMRGWTGVIQSQTESCGHCVLLVHWDHDHSASYVFPEDIVLLDDPPAGPSRIGISCHA
jgi:hypothetical protein